MAQIQFEDILPWGTTGGDTGLSSRLKLKRNFDKIKLFFDQWPDLSGEATAWGRTFWQDGVPVTIPTTDDLTLTGGARLLLGDGVLSWDDVLGVGLWSRGLAALGSVSALGYSAAGGGGDVALGPLLTLLNDEPVPVTDGYLHWTGSAFEWVEPGGGGDMPSTVAWNNITGKPATFTPSEHDHDGRYYIDGGTIYLGGNSITPLTQHQSLAGYAKEAYVQQACDSVVSFVASHYVQQETGKGLSANDFTNELLAKLNGIEAGANKYVHPSYSAAEITASAGKVLSAITVNGLGHVTSVASKTLTTADIPALAASKITSGTFDAARIPGLPASKITSGVLDVARIPSLTKSKISDFPTTWAWSAITGTPTTLAGYGITDAATAAQMTAATGRISTLEGYFDGGVANSAKRLSGNTAYTAWGQTYWQNGVPKGSFEGNLTVGTDNHISFKDSDGTGRQVLDYEGEELWLGWGTTSEKASPTNIIGNGVYIQRKTDSSYEAVLAATADGNVGIGTTNPTEKLHVVGNIMATGAVSALGYSADGGGAAGATYLRELLDVNIGGTPSAGQVLTYRNGYWVAETMQVPTPDLSAYATQAWVQQNWQIKSLSNVYNDSPHAIIHGDYIPYNVELVNGVLTVTYGPLPYQTVYWDDIEDRPDVVTALGASGDYVTWTREGVTNNLTVPFATRASELKHYAAGNTSPDGIAGSFAWSGSGALHSGYDYVGLQVGDSLDKWQLTLIDHLQFRQNDSGGTDASHWGAWRTLIDSANWQSFISMSSLGVTDALAGYLPLTGGTLTGSLTLSKNSVSGGMTIDTSTGLLTIGSDAGVNIVGDTTYPLLIQGAVAATQPWVTAQMAGYLPLTAGADKPLTGILWMDNNLVMANPNHTTNDDSTKIAFYTNKNYPNISPYIQALYEGSYGRKRLSVFQKSVADWDTPQVEVLSVMPDGKLRLTQAIAYKGTKATYDMITFLDNTKDIYGNGIAIGGGGMTVIGGGESAATIVSGWLAMDKANHYGGNEMMYIGNDGAVSIFTNLQGGWEYRKEFYFDADGWFWLPAGTGGRQAILHPDGQFQVRAVTGGWAYSFGAFNNAGSASLGQFGSHGGGDSLTYMYIGRAYNDTWMTILPSGNVGIGTTAPTEKLHVIGNILATGSMSANIAEVSNAAGGLVLMSAESGYLGKLRVFDTSRGADAVSFYAADGSSVRNGLTADFGANSLKIGNGTAGWDYSAGLLKLTGGMYATGAVAALGLSSASGDAVVGSLTATGDMTVSGSASFEDALDVQSDVFVGDSLYLSGDRTHRLYVENGHLYFNGQLVK